MSFSLCQGLTTMSTALMAERAAALGGKYLHLLFCIPTNDWPPQRLAESAIMKILRQPFKIAFIRALDILYFDEMGQNSAQMLATIDIICRRMHGSELFMGGIIILGKIDDLELRPITGQPILLSPHIMTSFSILRLDRLVQCSTDPNLQQIIDISHMKRSEYEKDESLLSKVGNKLIQHCIWLNNWDSTQIPPSAL